MTLIATLTPVNYPPCITCAHSRDVYGNEYVGGDGAKCEILLDPVTNERAYCEDLRSVDTPTNRCGLIGAFHQDKLLA